MGFVDKFLTSCEFPIAPLKSSPMRTFYIVTAIFLFYPMVAWSDPHSTQKIAEAFAVASTKEPKECRSRETALRGALSNKESIPKVLNKIGQSNPDIFLLGESHFHGAGALGYDGLLKMFSEAQLAPNCIFVESDRSFQPAYDKYLRGEIDFRTFIETDYTLNSDKLRATLDFAKANGIKVYAVDDYTKGLDTQFRNYSMASKIDELIKKNGCKKSVAIGGWGHFVSKRASLLKRLVGIHELLRKKQLRVVNIRLVANNDEYRGSKTLGSKDSSKFSEWTWDHCSWNPDVSLDHLGAAFNTSALNVPMVTPISSEDSPKWSNFDFAFITPPQK